MMTMVHNESQARMTGGAAGARSGDEPRHPGSQASLDREQAEAQAPSKNKAKPKRRSRFTAWWFARKIIVLAMFVGALTGGLYLGFVVLGKGSMEDAFDVATYKHIYDLIFTDS